MVRAEHCLLATFHAIKRKACVKRLEIITDYAVMPHSRQSKLSNPNPHYILESLNKK